MLNRLVVTEGLDVARIADYEAETRMLPNVLKAYDQHHSQGFEIIGISLDSDKGKLEKFIADKKMPWPQDFTGDGWKTSLAKKFGINSIPATYLIGKDGKVAALNLRGSALAAAVKKELGQ